MGCRKTKRASGRAHADPSRLSYCYRGWDQVNLARRDDKLALAISLIQCTKCDQSEN